MGRRRARFRYIELLAIWLYDTRIHRYIHKPDLFTRILRCAMVFVIQVVMCGAVPSTVRSVSLYSTCSRGNVTVHGRTVKSTVRNEHNAPYRKYIPIIIFIFLSLAIIYYITNSWWYSDDRFHLNNPTHLHKYCLLIYLIASYVNICLVCDVVKIYIQTEGFAHEIQLYPVSRWNIRLIKIIIIHRSSLRSRESRWSSGNLNFSEPSKEPNEYSNLAAGCTGSSISFLGNPSHIYRYL